jgi:hypothetical protein
VTDAEFREILDDQTKTIEGDIQWTQDKTMSHVLIFRVKVENEPGFSLWVKGSYNRDLDKVSFPLFDQNTGRLFGIDSGQDHHNRGCQWVGELHVHRWNEATKDREAALFSLPSNAEMTPAALWAEFCRQAKITHNGGLPNPPVKVQMDLF